MRLLLLLTIAAPFLDAQSPTGSIQGSVTDSATHAPVKQAIITTWYAALATEQSLRDGASTRIQPLRQVTAKSDASGAFVLPDLPPGSYTLHISHSRYSQMRGPVSKTVQVKAGETASVSFELTPGATITGRVVDEDGDPLPGCGPQLIPVHPLDPVGMVGNQSSDANGVYTVWGVSPGKLKLLMRCGNAVLEPFPLQPVTQPHPAPTLAYPPTYYPGVTNVQEAQVIEILPGMEKSGVDFQMKRARVFSLKGTLRGGDLSRANVTLAPRSRSDDGVWGGSGAAVDAAKGTFAIERVFPGSYTVLAFLPDERGPYGARQNVEVPAPGPVDLELKPGVDISGKVEVEGEFKLPLSAISVQLNSTEPMGRGSTPPKTSADGAFTFSRVIPGVYHVEAYGPNVFVKSVEWGGHDVPDNIVDTSTGAAGPLRVVLSTKTATIRGMAPVGHFVEAIAISSPHPMRSGAMVDQQGSFTLGGLRPGKYRVVLGGTQSTDGNPGEEVTLSEGETATVTVREPDQR